MTYFLFIEGEYDNQLKMKKDGEDLHDRSVIIIYAILTLWSPFVVLDHTEQSDEKEQSFLSLPIDHQGNHGEVPSFNGQCLFEILLSD